jgi:hypothetical protein
MDRDSDQRLLERLLSGDAEAQKRYTRLKDFQVDMCFRWIDEASTPELREQRIRRLARRLQLTAFDPYYDLAGMVIDELTDLYGPSRLFSELTPEEQAAALRERRVLGASHTRNFDDSGTWLRAPGPDDRLNDDILVVYPHPCVLTERDIAWLQRNDWETNEEARGYLVDSET